MIYNAISREEHEVKHFQVDAGSFMRPDALLDFLQSSGLESPWTGGGPFALENENSGSTWELSRVSLEIEDYPVWKDRLWIETWNRSPVGVFFPQELRFGHRETRRLGRGSVAWTLRKPGSGPGGEAETFALRGGCRDDLEAFRLLPEALEFPKAPLEKKRGGVFAARYDDLSAGGRVHNIRAFSWCLAEHGSDFRRRFRPWVIDLNFLGAVRCDENLSVHRALIRSEPQGCEYFYRVVRHDDGGDVLRARIRYRSFLGPGRFLQI